jgi:anti-sigma B factor antagonist
MEIQQSQKGSVQIFSLNGRLDSNTSPQLERQIFDAIESGTRRIVIDCKHLDYITSAGLRVLNKTAKHLSRTEGSLALCAMEDYVREVFEIAGFDAFLPIVANVDEAFGRVTQV